MPVKVSLEAKLKSEFLDPIRLGQKVVNTKTPLATLEGQFTKALQAINSSLNSDVENAKGTKLRMLLIKDCTTLSDPKPQNIAILIPPSKESKFKLKAMSKLPGIKNSKEIGLYEITAVGEKDGNLHIFDLVRAASKFKMTPLFFNALNKLAKKKGLKFRAPVEEKEEKQKDVPKKQDLPKTKPSSTSKAFETIEAGLKAAFENYEKTPNLELLKICGSEVSKLKDYAQESKNDPNFKTIKAALLSWSDRFKNSKTLLSKGNQNDLTSVLDKLETDVSKSQKQANLDTFLGLLSKCQQIRTNPKYKNSFKTDSNALNKFKAIRQSISSFIDNNQELKSELEEKVENPEKTKQELRKIAVNHWENFVEDATTIESFNAMLKQCIPSLKENIKTFQNQVENTARGLIESSKILKLGGDALVISEKMTELRSGIVQLKNQLEIQVKQAEEKAKELALIENQFLKADQEERKELLQKIHSIESSIQWGDIEVILN